MRKKFNVACFQTNSSDIPKENIEMLEKMFKVLKSRSVDLVCLPECVSIFTDSKAKLNEYSTKWHKEFMNFIVKSAKKYNTKILIGSFPLRKKNKKFLNRSTLVDKNGEIMCKYDKINLFDVVLNNKEKYLESKNFDSGRRTELVELPWGNLGLSICYDLRFPNLFKRLARRGADFFSIPAAFTYTTGQSHWNTLVRARAIENGCFVFAAAQCGYHRNGRRTFGHSLIVNPWGNILAEAKDKVCVIFASIEKDMVDDLRKKIPSMTDYNF
jgi:hypothetical protein